MGGYSIKTHASPREGWRSPSPLGATKGYWFSIRYIVGMYGGNLGFCSLSLGTSSPSRPEGVNGVR